MESREKKKRGLPRTKKTRRSPTKKRRIAWGSPTAPSLSPSPKTRKLATMKSLETTLKTRDVVNLLEKVCPRSDMCLALSAEYMPHINQAFHTFSNFRMLSTQHHGEQFLNISSGSNGFVNQLYYTNSTGKYSSMAIFKSAYNKKDEKLPDNSVYEGLVGLYYINDQCYHFPCFVETYGIYAYDGAETGLPPLKNYLLNNTKDNYKEIPKEEFEKGIRPLFTNTKTNMQIKNGNSLKRTLYNSKAIHYAFDNPSNLCVLIQSIKNATNIYDYLNGVLLNIYNEPDVKKREFQINEELITMIFQIYSVLGYISDSFTHNDLHMGNVLVYSLGNKYIRMVYHMKKKGEDKEQVVSFYTNKILKIIDYGRSYVKGENFSSVCFYQSVCQHEKMLEKRNSVSTPTKIPEMSTESIRINTSDSLVTSKIPKSPIQNSTIEYECDESNITKFQENTNRVCGEKMGFSSLWKAPKNPATTKYASIVHRNKTIDLFFIQKIAFSLMFYVYKYESISAPNVIPKILDHIKSPIFDLIMNVFGVYRTIYVGIENNIFTELMGEVYQYFKKENMQIGNSDNSDPNYIYHLLFYSISSSNIIKHIQTNNPTLYQKIVKFETTVKPSLFNQDAKQGFEKYKKLLDEKKNNKSDPQKWKEHGKKIKTQLMKANMHYLAKNMYAIPELIDENIALSTVEKVSSHLVTIMSGKMHEETYATKSKGKNPEYYVDYEMVSREYFESIDGTEYFGELHVYLDGSERQTHFEGVTDM